MVKEKTREEAKEYEGWGGQGRDVIRIGWKSGKDESKKKNLRIDLKYFFSNILYRKNKSASYIFFSNIFFSRFTKHLF